MTGNASESAHPVTDRASRAAHEAVDAVSERGGHAEERLRATSQRASERGSDIVGQVGGYVREHPVTSLGIAVAAGFLIGSILRR